MHSQIVIRGFSAKDDGQSTEIFFAIPQTMQPGIMKYFSTKSNGTNNYDLRIEGSSPEFE